MLFLPGRTMLAQVTFDVLGMHSLGPGDSSPITGPRSDVCLYCHAPHSGLNIGLWNQKLSTQTYTLYTSTTSTNTGKQPVLGYSSSQCLSCHDGTVAVGTTVVYGKEPMKGSMYSWDVFGSNMQVSHPFSFVKPLKDNIDLAASLVANGKTLDPNHKVKLVYGNVECTSCHNPHIQALDLISQNFLVENSASGSMCLACHDPTRTISGKVNPIADWAPSAHATSGLKILPAANVGSYTTVATSACSSCHASHNANGPQRLLRGLNEQDCIACHNGANVTSMPPYANVFAEYATPKVGHPFPSTNNPHDAAEATLLNNNRHATCVDCHNGHSSQIVGTFPPPPLIRISQKDIAGVSSTDGVTILNPAVNQFENCLRCHGNSTGKQTLPIYGYAPVRAVVSNSDPLNVNLQLAASSSYSSHPVTHTSNSTLAQTSLLPNMLYLDGVTQGRAMGTQILCSDCHNSDDNREFGGTGANGTHGSKWTHILERRYEFSQTLTPGQTITNLFPTPDLSSLGPYALCGKCHNLTSVVVNGTSWSGHVNHVNTDGFTCSTCHTAHGMGTTNPNITGERLINFDVNVVAQNGATPISYTHTNNTCVLVCHQVAHNADGTVTALNIRKKVGVVTKK
jgi:predicted CXXCH cytochrome family protein